MSLCINVYTKFERDTRYKIQASFSFGRHVGGQSCTNPTTVKPLLSDTLGTFPSVRLGTEQ